MHACSPTARTRSPSTPSIRSASPSCASMGPRPASVADFRVAGETERIALLADDARTQRAQGRAAAARDLPGEANAELGWRRGNGGAGGLCPRDGVAQLDRLRRSRRACGPRPDVGSAHRRVLSPPLAVDLGRRIPGCRRAAIPAADPAGAARRQPVRDRRPQPGDLRLSWRRCILLRPLSAGLPGGPDRTPCAQLSLDRHHRQRLLTGHCTATERAGRRNRARHARAHRHPGRGHGAGRGRVGGEDDRAHDRRPHLFLDRQRTRRTWPASEQIVR